MRAVTLSFLLTLTLAACQPLPVAGQHTSANSLDWAGVYRGVVPCADCPGIETTLKLAPDQTYELSLKYLGTSTAPLSSAGSFEWRQDGRAILLKTGDGTLRFYRVEENRSKLENTYWRLTRLGTAAVVIADNQREPHHSPSG